MTDVHVHEPVVKVEKVDDGSIAIVTLNRPDVRNAINVDLCSSLAVVFRELERDNAVKAVVLTGAGRSFCAGIDLAAPVNALQQASDDPEDVEVNPVRAMNDFTRPIIGAINGAAVTGGFELALACDILIGSERARFQDTHCSVGVVPCWGLSQKLSRTVGPVRARLASLTASSIDARTAEQWGILARVVLDADDTVGGGSGGSRSGGRGGAGGLMGGDEERAGTTPLLRECLALARAVAGLNGALVRAYKATLNDGFRLPLGEGLELEQRRAAQQYASLGQQSIAGRAGGALRAKL
jgi:enoyl-CoA hydratase